MWFICARIVINKQTKLFFHQMGSVTNKCTKFVFDRGSASGPTESSRCSPDHLVGWRGSHAPPLYVYKISFYHTNQKIVHASDIKDANKPFLVLGFVILSGMRGADLVG